MEDKTSRIERIGVLLFALARTAFCCYRAATQSITIDEASTYLNYVQHWADVWNNYDPNNHVLFSLLAQVCVRLLHVSELSLRLPTIVAGFFFVIGVHRILALAVPSAIIRWVTLVGVSIAPLVLDFSVAARGYGLGLTLLIWAVYFSMRGRDISAGICGGLAVGTTLHLAFSLLSLIACPLVLGKGSLRSRLRRANRVAEPAAIILFIVCFPILRQGTLAQFYVGLANFGDAMFNFVSLTLRAYPGHGGWLGSGSMIRAFEYFIVPVITLFVLAVSTRLFLLDRKSRWALVPALTLLFSLVLIFAARFVLGLNYPVDRLWLHLFVLFAIAWAIAVAQVPATGVRIANGVLGLVIVAQMLTQLHTGYFTPWQFDAATKEVARIIQDDVRGAAPGSVSVSATWYQYPALEYYRRAYRIEALQPIERHDPTELSGYDYYVLNLEHENPKLPPLSDGHRLFQDSLSGVVLVK